MKNRYNSTVTACFVGYIVQAIVFPILLLTGCLLCRSKIGKK